MFGSAARGELQEISDIDLLVVRPDGDPADPRRTGFDICAAMGYEPRSDVTLAFEKDVRRAARDPASVQRVACEEGVVLYRSLARPRRLPVAGTQDTRPGGVTAGATASGAGARRSASVSSSSIPAT